MNIRLLPLTCDDREQFIPDHREAFNYGAPEESGCRAALSRNSMGVS